MKKKHMNNILTNFGYLIIASIWSIPLYYLIVTTLKTPEDALNNPLGLPHLFVFENYIRAFKAMNYIQAFSNNLLILILSLTSVILLSSMAAFAIARSKQKVVAIIYDVFVIGLIIPFQIAIIPLYKIINSIHLMDTLTGVSLVNIFCINMAFSIFLFKGFIKSLPIELDEAASIDGCGVYRTFFFIIFPILKPIVATVSILVSLSIWNQYMPPLLFLQSPKNAVLLQEVAKNIGPFATDWTFLFPMLVLSVLPLVVVYLILQKYIIEGAVSGSLKG